MPTEVVNGPEGDAERYIVYVPDVIGVPLGPGGAVHVSTTDGMFEPTAVAARPVGAGKEQPGIVIPVIQLIVADACCSETHIIERKTSVKTSRVGRAAYPFKLFNEFFTPFFTKLLAKKVAAS